MEAAVLLDYDGNVLYEHVPSDRGAAVLPDSGALWRAIVKYGNRVAGVAHSHPGSGVPYPSHEDLTTFAAVEGPFGIARRIVWPIITCDVVIAVEWYGPDRLDYAITGPRNNFAPWTVTLRRISNML